MNQPASGLRHAGPHSSIVALITQEYAEGRTVSVVPAGPDKTESLRLFAEVLAFPDYFGANLDALYDILRERILADPRAWTLIWDAAAHLRSADPAAYDGIVAVLADLTREFPNVHALIVDR